MEGEFTCIIAGPPRLIPWFGNSKVKVSPVERTPELAEFPFVTERTAVLVVPGGYTCGETFITGMMSSWAATPRADASRSAEAISPRIPW
jgi:hypothetical protein